jgi:hypothetical protein
MKVFISWSGERSKQLGGAIREWLPNVLQFTRPYFTPADIEKGARWDNEISKELQQSQFGIFVMTQEALSSSWIMFEAGAISKVVEKARICAIVFGINTTDLVGPLTTFQATVFNKDEVRQLLTTINNAAKDAGLAERNLDEAFEMWWPKLEQKVAAISSTAQPANSGPHRKDSDLLRENLELTRSLVAEHQKLVRVLTQSGLRDVEAVVRALRREANKQRGEPEDKAEIKGFWAWPSDGLTAKSE